MVILDLQLNNKRKKWDIPDLKKNTLVVLKTLFIFIFICRFLQHVLKIKTCCKCHVENSPGGIEENQA